MIVREKSSEQLAGDRQLGFLIGLASWGMLFGTFLLCYLLYRARAPQWPPLGTETIPPLLPTVATGLLIASSFFIHSAYRQLLSQENGDFKKLWGVGTILGSMFLILQVSTWNHMIKMGMSIHSNFFASIYYTLTGLHALHVLAGLGILVWIWFHADRYTGNPGTNRHLVPQLSGWFWHFMDIIWLIMFVLLVLV